MTAQFDETRPFSSGEPPAQPAEQPMFDQLPGGGYHPDQVHAFISRLFARVHEAEEKVEHFAGGAEHALISAAGSPQATKLVAELMQLAADELTGQKQAAEQEIDQLLTQARADAEKLVADARDEADRVAAGAREQADTALEGARASAKQMTDQAAAHAAAVSEGAAQRLQQLMSLHEQTRERMAQVHEVTGQILAADADRGTLSDDVQRVLESAGHQALPAPETGEPPAGSPGEEPAGGPED